jgi:hypothetical protein
MAHQHAASEHQVSLTHQYNVVKGRTKLRVPRSRHPVERPDDGCTSSSGLGEWGLSVRESGEGFGSARTTRNDLVRHYFLQEAG